MCIAITSFIILFAVVATIVIADRIDRKIGPEISAVFIVISNLLVGAASVYFIGVCLGKI